MDDKTLKKLHQCEQEILDEVDRICDKYNLIYYLTGGTLLGAVRHKGFIPWDDDMDIVMPREDLEKFFDVAPSELGNKYFLQSQKTDSNWHRLYCKVRKNNTLFIEKKTKGLKHHQGIYIDIFPLDSGNRHNDLLERIKSKFVKTVNAHFQMFYGEVPMNWKHKLISYIFPISFFELVRKRWMNGSGDYFINYESRYHTLKYTFRKSVFNPPVLLEFEGKKYSVPREYKTVLSRIYGDDYMELPPEDARRTHNPVELSFNVNDNKV